MAVEMTPSRTVSRRSREVAELVSQGKTDKEIADQLGLAISTVHFYVRKLLRRHELRNRVELAVWWVQEGQ